MRTPMLNVPVQEVLRGVHGKINFRRSLYLRIPTVAANFKNIIFETRLLAGM